MKKLANELFHEFGTSPELRKITGITHIKISLIFGNRSRQFIIYKGDQEAAKWETRKTYRSVKLNYQVLTNILMSKPKDPAKAWQELDIY